MLIKCGCIEYNALQMILLLLHAVLIAFEARIHVYPKRIIVPAINICLCVTGEGQYGTLRDSGAGEEQSVLAAGDRRHRREARRCWQGLLRYVRCGVGCLALCCVAGRVVKS